MRIIHQYRYTDRDTHEILHRFSKRRALRDCADETEIGEVWAILDAGPSPIDCYSPEEANRVLAALNAAQVPA